MSKKIRRRSTERRTKPRYPVATLAYYGPDDRRATKIAVGIVEAEGAEPSEMKRWICEEGDVRNDRAIAQEVIAFLQSHGVGTTVATNGILGCPHEEGIDYPVGQPCPRCPFWSTSRSGERRADAGSLDARRASTAPGPQVTGVAWYSEREWLRLKELADDPAELYETYEQWCTSYETVSTQLASQGIHVERVPVVIDELADWCRAKGRPLDASSRGRYVLARLIESHEKPEA